MDPLAELEEISERGEKGGINFIPCIKWVQRGVAKSQPEKVRNSIPAKCKPPHIVLSATGQSFNMA